MKEIKKEKPSKYTELGLVIKMKWFNIIKDLDTKYGRGIAEIVTLKYENEDMVDQLCIKIRDEYFQPTGFTWEKFNPNEPWVGDDDDSHTKKVNMILDHIPDLQALRIDYEMYYEGYSMQFEGEEPFSEPYLKKEE